MKAKITKGFKHLGRWLNVGDEIDDEPAVIAALVDQGYAEAEDQPADQPAGQQQQQGQANQQTGAYSPAGKPNQQNQESKHHKGRGETQ